MTRKLVATLALLGIGAIGATSGYAETKERGRGSGPAIYVVSQDLYFDTILLGDLPFKGRFQRLFMGPNGPTTLYGPGDVGYVGGRWWVDDNGNGYMDEGDVFFLCPLLGPGRSDP